MPPRPSYPSRPCATGSSGDIDLIQGSRTTASTSQAHPSRRVSELSGPVLPPATRTSSTSRSVRPASPSPMPAGASISQYERVACQGTQHPRSRRRHAAGHAQRDSDGSIFFTTQRTASRSTVARSTSFFYDYTRHPALFVDARRHPRQQPRTSRSQIPTDTQISKLVPFVPSNPSSLLRRSTLPSSSGTTHALPPATGWESDQSQLPRYSSQTTLGYIFTRAPARASRPSTRPPTAGQAVYLSLDPSGRCGDGRSAAVRAAADRPQRAGYVYTFGARRRHRARYSSLSADDNSTNDSFRDHCSRPVDRQATREAFR